MITHRYDLMSAHKDREGKVYWTRVGVVFPSKDGKDGFSVKLECIPFPDERGQCWLQAMVPREREAQRGVPGPRGLGGSSPKSDDGMDGDSIPF